MFPWEGLWLQGAAYFQAFAEGTEAVWWTQAPGGRWGIYNGELSVFPPGGPQQAAGSASGSPYLSAQFSNQHVLARCVLCCAGKVAAPVHPPWSNLGVFLPMQTPPIAADLFLLFLSLIHSPCLALP